MLKCNVKTASAKHHEHFEFFRSRSIMVDHGPLTLQLQTISKGDALLVGCEPAGTPFIDNLLRGR
jgi:hypothetical protein